MRMCFMGDNTCLIRVVYMLLGIPIRQVPVLHWSAGVASGYGYTITYRVTETFYNFFFYSFYRLFGGPPVVKEISNWAAIYSKHTSG